MPSQHLDNMHTTCIWLICCRCQWSCHCTTICLGLRFGWFWTLASGHALHLPIIKVQVVHVDWGLKFEVWKILQYVRVQYLELSLRFEGQWGVNIEFSTKLEVLHSAQESWIRASEVMMKVRVDCWGNRQEFTQVNRYWLYWLRFEHVEYLHEDLTLY